MNVPDDFHFETHAVHAGEFLDATANAVTPPLYLTTTYARDEHGNIAPKGFNYTRLGNPNRKALEEKLAMLEQGAEAIAFASGMAAAQAIFQCALAPGDHVVISNDCYHGVAHLLKHMYPRWQVMITEVDMTDAAHVGAAIQGNTRLVIIETPSNPQLRIADIEAISALAKAKNVVVAVDNTWATPYIMQPLLLGADLVFHSSTKYFGGHSDVLGGCVVAKASNELTQRIREYQTIGGAVPSPFDCWLIYRGLATLPLRLDVQARNAAAIANFLHEHPKIEEVFYPGLTTHQNHHIAARQMKRNFGGMLSILVKGGSEEALSMAAKLRIFKHATSLGGVESLIEHRLSAEGINAKSPANLLRLSVGVEHVEDLISDLKQALA